MRSPLYGDLCGTRQLVVAHVTHGRFDGGAVDVSTPELSGQTAPPQTFAVSEGADECLGQAIIAQEFDPFESGNFFVDH